MRCILRAQSDPWFNLAAEEYVLRVFRDDCFMLWRNEPCIVVGKHQNTLAEVNYGYVMDRGIKVVRRISGGGTVYHDSGNINFTFVANGEKEKLVDFRRFTKPIIGVLADLGVDARFAGRNDLRINGKKFSGNAEHVYRNRVLHHGTLLFNSRLHELGDALRVEEGKYTDKAVKSVRSQVTNISYHLPSPIAVEEFMSLVMNYVAVSHPEAYFYSFNSDDVERIEQLVRTKYSTWEWNYAYSPGYSFRQEISLNPGGFNISFDVHHGIIENVQFDGTRHDTEFTTIIKKAMHGIPHRYDALLEALGNSEVKNFLIYTPLADFVKQLF